jgi:hypothetical protein
VDRVDDGAWIGRDLDVEGDMRGARVGERLDVRRGIGPARAEEALGRISFRALREGIW